MRVRILALLGVAAVAAAACRPRPGTESAPVHRNAPIVVISVDTLRADRLGAYGAAEPATPHLDALRSESILFADATSPCPLTLPAHVSLLSGLLPPDHGVRDNVGYRVAPDRPWLPRALKQQGYATGAAVSAHVLRAGTGMEGSFDAYDDRVGGPGPREALREAERPGAATAKIALDWIEKNRERPFFFFLHVYEPHSPYEPPEPFRGRYPSAYDGEVAAADQVVGDFVSGLKRLGLYDPAIVVFLSDHGEGLGQHGEEEHGVLLYREALRVPLLVKLPGSRRAGETVAAPVSLTDVFPMVAGLVGIELPAGLSPSPMLAELRHRGPPRSTARPGTPASTSAGALCAPSGTAGTTSSMAPAPRSTTSGRTRWKRRTCSHPLSSRRGRSSGSSTRVRRASPVPLPPIGRTCASSLPWGI